MSNTNNTFLETFCSVSGQDFLGQDWRPWTKILAAVLLLLN